MPNITISADLFRSSHCEILVAVTKRQHRTTSDGKVERIVDMGTVHLA